MTTAWKRPSMQAVPADLAILSKTPVEVSADLHDLLLRLRDELHSMRAATSMSNDMELSFSWRGKGSMIEIGNSEDAGVVLQIEYLGGVHPVLHGMNAQPVKIGMTGGHLDMERHPFASIPRLCQRVYEETADLFEERERRMGIVLRTFVDRAIELAGMAADADRRLPKGMIEPLRRRLLSVAASCHAAADEGLQTEAVVAYCAGPDTPMRAISRSPTLETGRRDMLSDEERIRWQSGFPPVMMLTGRTPHDLRFDTPHFGWTEGSPVELMRAIGGNLP